MQNCNIRTKPPQMHRPQFTPKSIAAPSPLQSPQP
jgi:hypothetical protein